MPHRPLPFLLLVIAWLSMLHQQAAAFDAVSWTQVVDRYRTYLLEGATVADVQKAELYSKELDAEGKWPDIDYTSTARSGWEPLQHANRCAKLWLAYRHTERSEFFVAGLRSLNWWLTNKPTESQWWHREIGVPLAMRDIIILAGEDLSHTERQAALRQLGQHEVKGVGANLMWSADLGLHYAALKWDHHGMARCSQLLAAEVKMSDGEGIQEDFSYHQHGPRLQTFHYGKAYIVTAIRIAWQLRDTAWAWPQEKVDLLTNYVLEGVRWQLRGQYTVPSTLDRAVTRKGALLVRSLDELKMLAELAPDHAPELLAFLETHKENRPAVLGFRWFPESDFAAYHTPEASFFLKTISTRTRHAEKINSENLLGDQLNAGDHYILYSGQEYFDLMGAWDWRALPGVTWAEHATQSERARYSGGVGNGQSGMVAWQQIVAGKSSGEELRVRKATFMHGGVIVTLMADLQATPGMGRVYTTLEQARYVAGRPTGYTTIGNLKIAGGTREQTGTWKAINSQYPDEPVTETVLKQQLFQDSIEAGSGEYYEILLSGTEGRTVPTHQRLENHSGVQAIQWADGPLMAAFHQADAVQRANGGIAVDRACLLLVEGNTAYLTDPLHQGGEITLRLDGGREITAQLPANGSTVQIALP